MKLSVLSFPEVERIPIGKQGMIGRHIMTEENVSRLLADPVVIEEKLDGKTVGTAIFSDYVIYGEYLKIRHSVSYDQLPMWVVGFDVFHIPTRSFFSRDAKEEVLKNSRIPVCPLIYRGPIKNMEELLPFLEAKSRFSTTSQVEGIVVKNYREQLMGKIVTEEFLMGLEKEPHWLKRKPQMNRLKLLPFFVSSVAMSLEGWQYT